MITKKAQYLLSLIVSICLFFQVSTIYSKYSKSFKNFENYESTILNDFKDLKYFNDLNIVLNDTSINNSNNIKNNKEIIASYYSLKETIVLNDNYNSLDDLDKRFVILHEYSHHLMKKEHLSFRLSENEYNNEIVTDIIAYSIFKNKYDFDYLGEIGYLANTKLIDSLDIDDKELEKLNKYLEKEWNNTFKL